VTCLLQGRDAYIELRVLADASQLEAGYDFGSGAKLFLVDSKCYSHNHHKSSRLVNTYTIAMPYLRTLLSSLFGEAGKREGALGPGDIALFFDGRAGGSSAAIAKELNKATRKHPQLKSRPTTVVRLMYHNREFRIGGVHALKSVRTGLHARLPEPLENLLVIPHRLTNLGVVDRKHLDLPGDVRSRGVANLALRSAEESDLSLVSRLTAKAALPDASTARARAADAEDCDDSASSAQEAPDAKADDASTTNLFPWVSPELMAREWLNLFGQNSSGSKENRLVVDFAAGGGAMVAACCRLKFKYLGFVHSDLQRLIIKESVALKIVTELILNKEDGFQLSRFLSRERSLGGVDGPSDSTKTEPKAPAKSGKKASTDKSSDSSSSSDSS
jgi:hypothetical protein